MAKDVLTMGSMKPDLAQDQTLLQRDFDHQLRRMAAAAYGAHTKTSDQPIHSFDSLPEEEIARWCKVAGVLKMGQLAEMYFGFQRALEKTQPPILHRPVEHCMDATTSAETTERAQQAYQSYRCSVGSHSGGQYARPPWADLSPEEQLGWKVAAQRLSLDQSPDP